MSEQKNTFALKSVKFSKGFPKINYKSNVLLNNENGEEHYYDDILHKSTLTPTVDFTQSISDLSGIMFKVMGFNLSEIFKGIGGLNESQENRLGKLNSQLEAKFIANGISLNGEDHKKTATITGYIFDKNECKVGLATSPILLSEEYYGIEGKLEEMIETIEEECKAFIFDKKSTQAVLDV